MPVLRYYEGEKSVLEVCSMWELKDTSGLKSTPRFLTVVLEARSVPSRVSISLDDAFLRCCRMSVLMTKVDKISRNSDRNSVQEYGPGAWFCITNRTGFPG